MDTNPIKSFQTNFLRNKLPLNPSWPTTISTQTMPSPPTTVYATHDLISHLVEEEQESEEELSAMKEMLYKIASMQPVNIDPSTIPKLKRRNVRISEDPQSVAARHKRELGERISEKMRILQRLVLGGTKMDTTSMLDEAIRYVKFLKRQIRVLQQSNNQQHPCLGSTNPFVL